jgi:hypothetical protein
MTEQDAINKVYEMANTYGWKIILATDYDIRWTADQLGYRELTDEDIASIKCHYGWRKIEDYAGSELMEGISDAITDHFEREEGE